MNTHSVRLVDLVEPLEARIAPAATLNLSSLHGSNGSQISGVASYDYSGISVSGAGDINGDGFDDLIIGAHGADANGYSSGTVSVLLGQEGGLGASPNLSALTGTNGFRIIGAAAGDHLGYAVGAAGDFNGDGLDDLIIGAPQAGPNGEDSGAAFVIFGSRSGFPAVLDVATLDGTAGFKINGAAAGDQAGGAVSGAGDFNGDGFDDLIIGAAGADGAGGEDPGAGASYVIFGGAAPPPAVLELSKLDGTNGFRITGERAGDASGTSVNTVGQFNDDNFADIIIGAPNATANGIVSGAAYVVFGTPAALSTTISLSSLGDSGFKINGESEDDQFGAAVGGGGDVNGDGFADLIVGAPNESEHNEYAGAAYVVFGRRAMAGPTVNVAALTGLDGFKIHGENEGDYAGMAVSNAGDVNGDGLSDLVVGAYGADVRGEYSGASYVVFGKGNSAFPADFRLSSLNGNNGFQINGEHEGDYAGMSVHGAGDINGDGVDDLVIGAPGASPNGTYSGSTYVIHGKADPNAPVIHSVVVEEPDGDRVTITLDGNWLTPRDIILNPDGSIASIDLTRMASSAQAFGANHSARPLNLTVAVKTPIGSSGDGLAKIGMINAKGVGLGKVTLHGSLGQIFAGNGAGKNAIGSLKIDGDLGVSAGSPQVTKLLGGIKKLVIGGTLQPDLLDINGSVKAIAIGVDFVGNFGPVGEQAIPRPVEGAAQGGNPLTGGVLVAKTIGSLKIGGSVKEAAVSVTEGIGKVSIFNDLLGGGFFSGGNINSVKVRGAIRADESSQPATFMARNGIDTLIINGDVENGLILAGYNKDGDPVNPDAKIGRIVVKGDWIKSSLVAGIADSTGDGFGQNDTVISGDTTPSIISKIAKVVIRGTASGSDTPGDHFGIVAQQIGRVSIGGTAVALNANTPDNILIDTANGDFRLVEVS